MKMVSMALKAPPIIYSSDNTYLSRGVLTLRYQ